MALSKIESQALDVGQIGGRRNLIINGAMQVAQRGDSSSVSTTTYGGPDRWRFAYEGSSSVWTLDHSTTSPEGFSNSYKLLCTTADGSQAASSQVAISQRIEAQNLQQLSYGASEAKSLTLSFWVRSNQTGTYAVHLYSQDGGRIIGSTYAISVADTWEYKTITFAGDTGGTINNDNGIGLEVKFFVSAGSTYRATDNTSWGAFADGKLAYGQTVDLADTLNNEWYITGVQLEVGTVATPYEHISYGEQLALCQRYYYRIQPGATTQHLSDFGNSQGSEFYACGEFPKNFRTRPTSLEQSGTASDYAANYQGINNYNLTAVPAYNIYTSKHFWSVECVASGLTSGRVYKLRSNNADAFLAWSVEL